MDLEQRLSDLVDDPDFQAIDRRMGRFNLFEAVGAVRGELRHSNFLAFLLSPSRNHGLGTEPLLRFLRMVLSTIPAAQRPIRALELIVGDLDGAVVHREWNSIDLLIEIKQLGLIVLIENKIGAKASDGQLDRYKEVVDARFPGQRHLLIFLTPDGHDPEHDSYVPASYSELARMIEALVADRIEGSEAGTILRHYVEMLRRHIVPDQELQDLARQLYERHKEAFDYVLKVRPDRGNLMQVAKSMFEETPGLVLDRAGASLVSFVPAAWSGVPELNACDPALWTRSGRTAMFEIKTYSTDAYRFRVSVALVVGPAPEEIRNRIYAAARDRPKQFRNLVKPMGLKFATIFARDLLSHVAGKAMEDEEERAAAVQAAWAAFVSEDLPGLTTAMVETATSETAAVAAVSEHV